MEEIAILTALVSQYEISIKEEPHFTHKTFKQQKLGIQHSSY